MLLPRRHDLLPRHLPRLPVPPRPPRAADFPTPALTTVAGACDPPDRRRQHAGALLDVGAGRHRHVFRRLLRDPDGRYGNRVSVQSAFGAHVCGQHDELSGYGAVDGEAGWRAVDGAGLGGV